MQLVRGRTALLLSISTVLAAGGIVIVRQSARLAGYERLHAQDARALGQLRAALREEQARNRAPAASPAEAEPAPPPGRSSASDRSALAERDASIRQLSRELEQAQAEIARLPAQLQSAVQEKQTAQSSAGEDFQKREQKWRDRLDALRQQLDSARAEAQAARERAASLDADNTKLKSASGTVSAQAAELRQATAGLQDLDRRRDGYLNSIIRRYREITDQFRAMTGTLDSSHGSESASFSGIALSRIQNAISLAEDDLRRLNELNAQAHQLENKLAKQVK